MLAMADEVCEGESRPPHCHTVCMGRTQELFWHFLVDGPEAQGGPPPARTHEATIQDGEGGSGRGARAPDEGGSLTHVDGAGRANMVDVSQVCPQALKGFTSYIVAALLAADANASCRPFPAEACDHAHSRGHSQAPAFTVPAWAARAPASPVGGHPCRQADQPDHTLVPHHQPQQGGG